MKNRIILAAALALLGPCLRAQDRNLFEFKGGPSFSTYRYEGDVSSRTGLASGVDFALRYTHFFNSGLGAYAQLGSIDVYASEPEFFGVANKADGGNYMYRYTGGGDYRRMLEPVFTLGAAYRFGYGRFSFIPRAGVGLAGMYCGDLDYERRARSGDKGPEYFSEEAVRDVESFDYLIDGPTFESDRASFVLSAAFQLSYKFGHRLSVFVEPGFDWAPASVGIRKSSVQSSKLYDPRNWVEAVAYSSASDVWKKDMSTEKVESVNAHVAPFFHLDFGIGISLFKSKKR